MSNLKLAHKLALAFICTTIATILVGGIGYFALERVSSSLTIVVAEKVPLERAVTEITRSYERAMRGVNAMLLFRIAPDIRARSYDMVEGALRSIDDEAARWSAIRHGEQAEKLFQQWRPAHDPWRRSLHDIVAAARDRDSLVSAGAGRDDPRVRDLEDKAFDAWNRARTLVLAAQEPLQQLQKVHVELAKETASNGQETARTARVLVLCTILLGSSLLALLGFVYSRMLAHELRSITRECAKLDAAIEAGTLDVRADRSAVHPEFRPIVDGMNATMDAFTRRWRIICEYMDRISKGDLPPIITRENHGEFLVAREAINRSIETLGTMIADIEQLAQAGIDGRLDVRADAARYQGVFRTAVDHVNTMLDNVVKPINEAAQVLDKLAARDLRARVVGQYRGDHAEIKEALNTTAEALHEAMAQVAQAVEQVSSASSQIASSSQAVASGASEQAASLEETSSSLESMASMTKQATDNAQQANGLAQRAKVAANEGSTAMEQMTGAMGKIKASAEGTSQIIKDINEIAFQTNLLALNAAVEAARAGDAGRGFAVVAEEVRSLALRSKQAANKTEDLIRQSVREAGEGEITSKHVHEKLADIAGSVMKVSDIVGEIAVAAREQAAGIDQVTKAVAQMNQVTQQNAASSEESSSAAAELSGQSEELAAMVATFQIQHGATHASTGSTTRSAAPPVKAHHALKPKNGRASGVNGASRANGTSGITVAAFSPAQLTPLEGDPVFKDF